MLSGDGARVNSTRQLRRGAPTSLSKVTLKYNIPAASMLKVLKEETHTGAQYFTPEQIEVVFRTSIERGLSEDYAAELLVRNGPNQLQNLKGTSYWKILRHNLCGWFQIVLWVGALLNFVAYFTSAASGPHNTREYLYLGTIITLTVIGTGLFAFYQEAKNMTVMSGFDKMVPTDAIVIRDGIRKNKPNNELVVGDIVEMSGGDIVPADVCIIFCTNFKTDMSSLTGESDLITHTNKCTDDNPLESKNMAYFGCPIAEGSARAVVVNTGELTQIGKIAGLVTGLEKEETPIAKEITHFIKIICAVAFLLGIAFFGMVYYVHRDYMKALVYMLGIILANVPEGLIVTLTVCMTLSAKQLRKKNCLAKTLQAVETLGSTSCICSDKTGTLTQNCMSVSHLLSNFKIINKDDHSHISEPVYSQLCFAASLNLKAYFLDDESIKIEKRRIIGDASEAAILRYMESQRNASSTQNSNPKIAQIPFSSVSKYQVTIHSLASDGSNYLIMKGAPEIITEYCTSIMTDTGVNDVTPQIKKILKECFIKLANMGERVIGYAELKLPWSSYPAGFKFITEGERNFPLGNLTFIGAISMIDPPRPEVKGSIALCRQAGIKVTMVTGDHPVTALAISRQVGTITHTTAYDYAFEHHIEVTDVPAHVRMQCLSAVITGDDLRKMTANDLRVRLQKFREITFARTSPQQKLFIVENYQALHYVVAVTGDGVNDSPALKKADIGIAMGITGTEVSKQAADMILMDDDFSSIVLGVQEGRRIFDNLKKTIAYTLTSNTPEMMPFVLYACVGFPLPMTLMLILVINVGTDLLPAMSLAYETPEEDIMKIPPRKPTDHLVGSVMIFMTYFQIGMIQFMGGIYAYFVVFADNGFFPSILFDIRDRWEDRNIFVPDSYGIAHSFKDRMKIEKMAQTAYFVAICGTQISDAIICKTRRISLLKKGMHNHFLNFSLIVDILAAMTVTYMPFCNEIFGTEPILWYHFLLSLPFMLLMILVDEFRRYFIRHSDNPWVSKETYY